MTDSNSGLRKSAILLLSLGEEAAAEVMRFMNPKEVQKLGQTMASLRNINSDEMHVILEEMGLAVQKQAPITQDQQQFLSNVLKKALGDEKAEMILSKIVSGADTSGIDSLKWMDAAAIADLLKNEHPQVIAAVLAHLEPEQSSEILFFFTERLRAEATLRLATLDSIQPAAMEDLNKALTKVLSGQNTLRQQKVGGIKATAEVLNYLGAQLESQIMDAIKEQDPDLAQKIIDEMFTFDDLVKIDDRGIQTLLREVTSDQLVIALKGAIPELKEKIFKNMGQRAAEALKEDLESRGPMKLSEVEREQKEILKIARRLMEDGQVVILGKGGEEML